MASPEQAGSTRGQSLVEAAILTGLVGLGMLAIWTTLDGLLSRWVAGILDMICRPIP